MIVTALFVTERVLQRADYKVYEFDQYSDARYGLTHVDDKSAVGRTDAWWMARQMFKRNFLLGVGDNQFRDYYIRDAHSIYFSILAEKGLVGVITFALLIWFCFKSLCKVKEFKDAPQGTHEFELYLLAQAAGIAIIGYLTHGILISKDKEFVFYMIVALCSAIGRMADKIKEEKDIEQKT
jgi:O-antigen ligase